MALIDKLYKSCVALSLKATKGMNALLRKSLIPPINPTGIISQTDIDVEKKGDVITIESHFPNYTYFVENGRKPGKMPPVEPIREWCELHHLPEGVEWGLRRKIGERGTKGHHFLEPLHRMLEMLQKTLKTESVKEFKTEYRGIVYEGTETLRSMDLKL